MVVVISLKYTRSRTCTVAAFYVAIAENVINAPSCEIQTMLVNNLFYLNLLTKLVIVISKLFTF